jgi:hypothetical protein
MKTKKSMQIFHLTIYFFFLIMALIEFSSNKILAIITILTYIAYTQFCVMLKNCE